MITVEVVYALPEEQALLTVKVLPNSTIYDAISASGILEKYPDINLEKNKVGVFGRKADLYDRLSPGDRVEIYRELIIDPKEARRLRAKDSSHIKN